MANYDLRTPIDYEFAQLSAGISSLDTTLSSAGFTNLPSTLSTTQYVPITLADDSAGIYETVWVTGHSANSTSVTVIRGREGTTSRAWASGTTYRCAPSIRDGLALYTRATLPTDAHLGMRAVLSDESTSVQKTSGGWVRPIGPGVKHAWSQIAGNVPADVDTPLVNLVAATGNGTVATYTPGGTTGNNLVLNRSGAWTLTLVADSDNSNPRWTKVWLNWPNGPWSMVTDTLRDQRAVPAASFAGAGAIRHTISWTGWVTSSMSTAPITAYARQNVNPAAAIPMDFYLLAEYLGG